MQCGVLNCGGNTQEGAEEVAVSFLFSSVTLTVYSDGTAKSVFRSYPERTAKAKTQETQTQRFSTS
jgi:hypothetical protein